MRATRLQSTVIVRPQITDLPVQPHFEKYFSFLATQITTVVRAVSSHQRGVSRSSRTRGGMRWTPMVLLTNSAEGGRRSRVVLTPRRWRQVSGIRSAGDGDNKARSPGRSRGKPLKPSCGECRAYPA